jgi:hypothetical protein
MLRAYVVIKEPRLIAVFSGAGVHILHVGLLGASCDRASFFSVVFRVLFSRFLERCNTPPPDFSPGKARDEGSRPPVCDQCSGECLG